MKKKNKEKARETFNLIKIFLVDAQGTKIK